MDDFVIARALHVAAVVFWIGGVAFVTTVLMPTLKATERPEDRLRRFQQVEGRFAGQARLWVLLAGVSGLWMILRADMWSRFANGHFWWMHLMVALWTVFALMLFVIEPFYLHRRLAALLRQRSTSRGWRACTSCCSRLVSSQFLARLAGARDFSERGQNH